MLLSTLSLGLNSLFFASLKKLMIKAVPKKEAMLFQVDSPAILRGINQTVSHKILSVDPMTLVW
jgi:hypothetical protein